MSDAEILIQMFKDTALVQKQKPYRKWMVELQEPQAEDSKVSIHHLPEDALIIKADAFRAPDTIFQGKHGECKRADYVIISAERKRIVHIELKRSKASKNAIIKQLKGARCLIEYCRAIGKHFWDEPHFLDGYQHRFVSIGRTSISKRPTRISKRNSAHDTPERMLTLQAPHHLQFNELAQ